MSDFLILPIILLVVLVVVMLFVFVQRQRKQRTAAMRELARQMGFEFQETSEGVPGPIPADLHLFRQGSSSASRDILHGDIGRYEVWSFDFTYRTQSGNNQKHAVTQSVAALRRNGRELPAFELRPENVLHRIGQAFGYQDIDIPEDEGFSKRYLLRGEDETAVRTLFPSYVREHLKRSEEGWCLEGEGAWVIAYRHRKKRRPEEVRTFLEEARTLVDMLDG